MKHILLTIFCLSAFLAQAQLTNEGQPKSWRMLQKSEIQPYILPTIDMATIRSEDAVNDLKRDTPWRFGKELQVDLDMKNSGVWDVLPNGDRIWRLNVKSSGAKTMNFVFRTYQLPPGATLYIYNDQRSDLLGAYTNVQNQEDEMLGTWLVEGDDIWLEYYEPKSVKNRGRLHLTKVVHGYRSVTESEAQEKALNDSGNCNHDVDCPVSANFDPLKEKLKHATGFIVLNGFVCSGALINNTNNDKAPYFLTANHCESGSESTWSFRFNWISQNPSCGTTTPSTDGSTNQIISGATVLAKNTRSDFKLLQLNEALPESWELTWAGWDVSGTAPQSSMGIHHPSGDIMKVCRDDDPATEAVFNFNEDPNAQMWRVADWDLGVTEGGSSGSPLYNENGLIVGQLAGGAAACQGTTDNDQFDIYGRMDVSWDFGNTNATRLSNWLDPTGSGVQSLPTLGVNDEVVFDSSIGVYPNPANDRLTIANGKGAELTYGIYNVLGQKILQGSFSDRSETIDVSNLKQGIYLLKMVSDQGATKTKKLVVRH
ncbi:T9SS type A sorting domain-containing protein [Croceiramulus getboli]|nr:T9SS type A sorting domain-containing protein [Flavobacteriaceae bacterium YJPT1-3]